jgi:hypothetical protein
MSHHIQPNPENDPHYNPYELPSPGRSRRPGKLPRWLAKRFLRPGEYLTWVRGPRWNPTFEWFITHPLLFLIALAIAGAIFAAGSFLQGVYPSNLAPVFGMFAVLLPVGSLIVLGMTNAYFTRLVVTDQKVLIVQGHEVCRLWGIDELPHSMVRFRKTETGEEVRDIDLDKMKTMLGQTGDGFVDAKTIKNFGKQLDQIRKLE